MPGSPSRKTVRFGEGTTSRSGPSRTSTSGSDSGPDPLYEQQALQQALQDAVRQVDEWKAKAQDVERHLTKKLRQSDANLQAINSRCHNLEDEKKELQRQKRELQREKKLKEAKLRADSPGPRAKIWGDSSHKGMVEVQEKVRFGSTGHDSEADAGTETEPELLNTTINETDDILCCLLPDSVAASQGITRLLSKSSPHVEVIPENPKRYPKATRDNKYGLVLRHSAPLKSPARGFQFGTDSSTCDICFISKGLNRVQFRIFKDVNGIPTIEGEFDGDTEVPSRVSVSSPSHGGNGVLRPAIRPIPLENGSRIVLNTHPKLVFRVALPLREKPDELSDVESLASVTDVPSLTSATTLSSLGSQLDISEATEELAILLLKDEKLGPLFHTSLQRTAADKIERNYTRLLRKFAHDLREEATNPVEHHVGRLVKFRARFISQTLVSAIDPSRQDRTAQWENLLHQNEGREWRMEQYLESLATSGDFAEAGKSTPLPIDSDGDISDDSGEEDNLPKLSQIKDFIMTSEALAMLRTRLRDFVSPDKVTPIVMEQSDTQGACEGPTGDRLSNLEVYLGAVLRLLTRIDQRTVSAIAKAFLELLRPRIPKGHQRITWGCGKPMYSDVQELYAGGATELEQQLRRTAGAAARSQAGPDASPQGTTISSSDTNALSGSSLVPGPGANTDPKLSGTASGNILAVEPGSHAGPLITSRFLLLCVNGPRFSQLRQVPLTSQQVSVASHDNDKILFDNIRKAYIEVCQSYQPTLHPETPVVVKIFVEAIYRTWKATQTLTAKIFKLLRLQWLVWWIGDDVFFIPKSAEFVRFEVIPLKEEHVPEILESACLPPEEEVLKNNYHYAPCPQEVKNPLLRIPWLHVLFEPGAHSSDFWTQRIPKKLAQMLNYPSSSSTPVIGWGVHIVEGPNWHALTLLIIIFNFLSLFIALVYSVVKIDISGGFAVGSFFLAVETMVVTVVLAVVTTSLLSNR